MRVSGGEGRIWQKSGRVGWTGGGGGGGDGVMERRVGVAEGVVEGWM